MLNVRVTCTCSQCGKEFIKSQACKTAEEAKVWENYCYEHYKLCKECWLENRPTEAYYAKREQDGIQLEVRLGDAAINSQAECYVIVPCAVSLAQKEALKEIGAQWSPVYPTGEEPKIYTGYKPTPVMKKHYVIVCKLSEYQGVVKKIFAGLGDVKIRVKNVPISETQLAQWNAERSKSVQMMLGGPYDGWTYAQLEATANTLDPEMPDEARSFVEMKREEGWNGRMYRSRQGEPLIYVGSTPTAVGKDGKIYNQYLLECEAIQVKRTVARNLCNYLKRLEEVNKHTQESKEN